MLGNEVKSVGEVSLPPGPRCSLSVLWKQQPSVASEGAVAPHFVFFRALNTSLRTLYTLLVTFSSSTRVSTPQGWGLCVSGSLLNP